MRNILLSTAAAVVALLAAAPAWAIGNDPTDAYPRPVTATASATAAPVITNAPKSVSKVTVNVAAPAPAATPGAGLTAAGDPRTGTRAARQPAPAPSYAASGVTTSARAPDIVVPGAAGLDCPTVGFGASGAGLTGGGGFGPSWISSRCDHRKYAMDVILPLLGRDAALAYLASVEPDVKEFADKWARAHEVPAPADPVAAQVTYRIKPGAPKFCRVPGLHVEAYSRECLYQRPEYP